MAKNAELGAVFSKLSKCRMPKMFYISNRDQKINLPTDLELNKRQNCKWVPIFWRQDLLNNEHLDIVLEIVQKKMKFAYSLFFQQEDELRHPGLQDEARWNFGRVVSRKLG